MTAIADPERKVSTKKSKIPLIISILLALVGGAGGFVAVKVGLIGAAADDDTNAEGEGEKTVSDLRPVSYVPLDPLIISLNDNGTRRFLRFSAQLEVPPQYVDDVESVKPRIVDILNGYLRAVTIAELDDPTMLAKIRLHMLRRVQVVAGEGRVRDMLIMEFVLN